MSSRTFAADDADTISARLKELAKEREEARFSCPKAPGGLRVSTDERCAVHGTPPALVALARGRGYEPPVGRIYYITKEPK
jgi:hypothetical protein